jgi:hypothetical protein
MSTRDIARLLLTERRGIEAPDYQYVNHELGIAHFAVNFAAVGVKWGQRTQHGLHAMWPQPP